MAAYLAWTQEALEKPNQAAESQAAEICDLKSRLNYVNSQLSEAKRRLHNVGQLIDYLVVESMATQEALKTSIPTAERLRKATSALDRFGWRELKENADD